MPTNRPLKKIEECLDKTSFSVGKIKTQDNLSEGKFPIIDQGKELIAGYSNDEFLVYDGKLPVIIYGDHTNIIKYVDFPFICGADGTKVFKLKDGIDTKFFVYWLEHFKPETQGYRRHYSLLKEISFPLPPLPTQQLIVAKLDETFAQIDAAIAATQVNIDKTDELTKSVLDKVFEEGEWEKVKLEAIITLNYGKGLDKKDRSESGKYNVYGANGVLAKSDKYLIEGDSIIIGRKGSAGALTRINGKFRPTDVTYYVTLNKKLNMDYIYLALKRLNLESLAQGVKPGINRNDVYDIVVPLPPLAKQQEIVSYLDDVFAQSSQLKEQYQKKLVELKELKASVLQSAFEGKLV